MTIELINSRFIFEISHVGQCFKLQLELKTTTAKYKKIGIPRVFNTKRSAKVNIEATKKNGSLPFLCFIRKRNEGEYFFSVQGRNGQEIHVVGPHESYKEALLLQEVFNRRISQATVRDVTKDKRFKFVEG